MNHRLNNFPKKQKSDEGERETSKYINIKCGKKLTINDQNMKE